MRVLPLPLVLLAGVTASFDDGASSSSSAGPGSCDACEFIEGFVQGYIQGQMTCGSELTDFEGGANNILSGLSSMVGSSTPSTNGWSSISSGFSEIEKGTVATVDPRSSCLFCNAHGLPGLSSCAEQSWWSDFESDVENVFENLVPELKLVADAYGQS